MRRDVPKSELRDARDWPVTVARLREIGLFGALSDETLEHLGRRLTTAVVGPGDTIFREGDGSAREMYVLLEGEMEVAKRSRRGDEVRIAILGPTDWFGEMSILDMQSRSATVRVLAPSRLLRITSADLDALYRFDLKSYALILLNMARDLSRRLRVTDALVADLSSAGALEANKAAPEGSQG
jgi:CRP/FNR family transcriptional regulator, cyclic AMP receptor protein